MTSTKSGFRSYLRDVVQRRTGEHFDSLNDFQRSQWMTRVYLEDVLGVLNPGLLPEDREDFDDCMADGPSDAGVDFLYRSEGHVLIVQAKYRGHGRTEPEADFDHFCEVLSRIHPSRNRQYRVSQRVKELASDIDWQRDTFDLHYVTLGRATDNIRARERGGQAPLPFCAGLEDRVELTVLEEASLNEKLREAESAGEQIQEPIDLRFMAPTDTPPWLRYNGPEGHTSYVGFIQAATLRNLYARHKYRLFAQNIRNYVGDTSTNKGIVSTALHEPENFFFFNNGIAAICTAIQPLEDQRSLRCTQFSIINGAQTVRSLAKAHLADPASAASATVLVRVSLVSLRHSDRDEAFLDKITRYNNTQNAVKVSDFRSNDPIQRGLNRKFAQLVRGGKHYWYKNKRSSERDPRKIPIGMEDFAKTVFAFRFGPADMFGGAAYLFDTSAEGGYISLFGLDGELPQTLSDDHFCLLAGLYFMGESVRETLTLQKAVLLEGADEKNQATIRQALERRWLIYFAVGELLRAKYRRDRLSLDRDITRLAKPRWLEESHGPKAFLADYVAQAAEILLRLYRAAARSPQFAHRNWFRSADTLRDIRSDVQFATSAMARLQPLFPGNEGQ